MQRHCGRCHTDFDDALSLSVCPHHFGDHAQAQTYNLLMDTLEELIMADLEDLVLSSTHIHSIPNFHLSEVVLRRES